MKKSSDFLLPKFRLARKISVRTSALDCGSQAFDSGGYLQFSFTGGYCFPVPGFDLLPACCVQCVGPEYACSRGQFLTIMHMPKRPLLEYHIVASLNV